MYFFNTLSRSKELFTPIKKGQVGIYTCGPTVYSYPHIGNLRAYIFADILNRSLQFLDYEVCHIINITDVGHLTSDSDEGEDKMELSAKREHKTVWEIAEFFTEEFKKNLKELNIISITKFVKATDHIAEQIQLIQILEQKGYTYILSDGVYFNISKFKDYGKLGRQKMEEKLAGARVVKKDTKRNFADFALWKFATGEHAKHAMQWDSPWGRGFPGWHIECSAMSLKYLAQEVLEQAVQLAIPMHREENQQTKLPVIDIHTGGVDHIAIHHENEIAQSEGATGRPFVKYWLHNEFLLVNGGKMSKSLNNFYRIDDLKKRNFNPLAFRYLCLQTHYRQKLNFTWEGLESAQNALNKLRVAISSLPSISNFHLNSPLIKGVRGISFYEQAFIVALEDDLNIPKALAVMWDLIHDNNVLPVEKRYVLEKFDNVFGFGFADFKKVEVPAEILKLVEKREEARRKKDFAESDKLRAQIIKLGWEARDEVDGPQLKQVISNK